jgi:hypothetical protein
MKNLMLIVSMLFLLSCGSEATKNKQDSQVDAEKVKTEEAITEQAEETPKNECEQFLADYEAWVVELENTRKELNADPSNDKLKQKLLQASQKNTDWLNKWDSLADCESNEVYDDKMLDIEDRLNKCTML